MSTFKSLALFPCTTFYREQFFSEVRDITVVLKCPTADLQRINDVLVNIPGFI